MKTIYLNFVILLIFTFEANSQVKIKTDYLDSNYYSITDTLKLKKNEVLFFFCPLKSIDTSEYFKKINDFLIDSRLNQINNFEIRVVYFKAGKSHNEGLRINAKDSTFYISEIESYIANFDAKNLERAKKIHQKMFNSKVIKENINFNKITIVDSTICFKKYSDRIKYYDIFVSEVFSPDYSDREIIDNQNQEIKLLKNKIEAIEQKLFRIEKECFNE